MLYKLLNVCRKGFVEVGVRSEGFSQRICESLEFFWDGDGCRAFVNERWDEEWLPG
jgi:hypothetical protein